MQFSDVTNNQGILQDIDFLAGTTSASYPTKDKTRNINIAYHDVTRLIWECADDWNYDDANATDLPKVLRTLGQASASYQIPTTAQKIERIEIQDANNNWIKLEPIDYSDINVALDEYRGTASQPTHYDLVGNYITLYPAPSSAYVTLSSGMALRVARNVTEFATTATTEVPGFATQFHRLLSIGASLDFEKDASSRNLLLQMQDRLQKGLRKMYSSREVEKRVELKPRSKSRWRQYR